MLKKLEMELFYLEMKDGWTRDDFEKSFKLKEEIRKLENEINNWTGKGREKSRPLQERS